MSRPSYPRRQQYRRMHRAVVSAAASATAAGLALVAARTAAPGGGSSAPAGDGRTADRCPPVAASRRPEPGRRPLGGRGAASARAARDGGLAAAPLAAVARAWGHRLGRDRSHRRGIRNRNKNQNPRGPARCSCARAGGMADPSPATMVQTRCAARSRALLDGVESSMSRPACWWSRSTGLRLPSAPSPGCEIVRASSGDIARLPRLNLLRARTPRHPAAGAQLRVEHRGADERLCGGCHATR